VFEGLLAAFFCFFPVGSCNTPLLGVVVCYLHFPAILILERVFSIGYSPRQMLMAAGLMVPIWISMFFLLHWILQLVHGANKSATPNVGPATPIGNSRDTEGPPSVS
jgi:hypothetical protein